MHLAVDWSAPWLAPYRATGQAVAAQAHLEGGNMAAALNAAAPAPVQFVPQSALPPGEAYEHFIFHTRQCPTRDNLHDFFNGLCWHHFPQTKTRINQLQAAEIAVAGVQPLRGPVRDALTVFDENAAFLIAPPALWAALRAQDWQRLFVTLRPLWAQAQLLLFGHALLEKLVHPRKPITAHVYCAQNAITSIAGLDAAVATQLSATHLGRKPFLPLPVLGVPGWWADNAHPDFYADTQVFRLPRRPP